MSPEETQKLKALIVATAMYYGHEIPDPVLALYVEDLADLPFEHVALAIRDVRRDPKTTRFPLPALIRDRIKPADTGDADAREAASRIVAAVSKYGWTNAERAREFIGELGWYVVDLQGGWQNVCQTLTTEAVPQFQAQWRELAASAHRRAKAGTLYIPPAMPKAALTGGQSGGLQRLGFVAPAPDARGMG